MALWSRFRRDSARRRPLEEMIAEDRAEHEVQTYVEARLLGIRLLSLRARVLTGRPRAPTSPRSSTSAVHSLAHTRPGERVDRRAAGPNGLGRAVDLLGESSSTLQELSARGTR
jgi:hypothetical protein